MKRLGSRRPSAALVVSIVALVVALGGTGYAALQVPRNSVGPRQIKAGAVTTPKLARGAVTGAKVKLGSLTGAQIVSSSLGPVPQSAHAGSADSAANASDAGKLGGSPPSSYQSRIGGTCSAGSAIAQVGADGAVGCNPTGSGTITGVTAGTGLSGGATSGAATLSIDTNYVQRRLNGFCTNGISFVDAAGAPGCVNRSVAPILLSGPAGGALKTADFEDEVPGLGITSDCGSISSGTRQLFIGTGSGSATLNWLYSDGTNVAASGASLPTAQTVAFAFTHKRTEGQFIYVNNGQVATISLHALDLSTLSAGLGCEVQGTVQIAHF